MTTVDDLERLLILIVNERIGSQSWLFDDALQEARIRAWQRLKQGKPKGIAVYAARQAVIDVLRGGRMTGSKGNPGKVDTYRRTTPIFRDDEDGEYVYEPEDTSATDAFEQIEAREALRPLLAALPARDRGIVAARYFEDLTQAEVAARYGVTPQAVSQILTRSTRKMAAVAA